MLKKIVMIILFLQLFTSCTFVNYSIDSTTYYSKNSNERIKFLIVHYTATSDEVGLRALTNGGVSSHYLITSKDLEPTYRLVPEEKRAWHAGISGFNGYNNLNDTSIGIEISNYGIENYDESEKKYGFFIPEEKYIEFSEAQIRKIANLLKNLIEKYDIKPTNILGHSDIAPTRKIDPGAKFPWERLYREYGIGAWYEEKDKVFYMNEEVYSLTPVHMMKEELRKYGYVVNSTDEWDEESRRVVYNFQAHFNPTKLSGNMDIETFAILKALNKKYR